MAPDMTDEERLAYHESQVEAFRRRVRVKNLRQAIAAKETAIASAQGELNTLKAELTNLLAGGDSTASPTSMPGELASDLGGESRASSPRQHAETVEPAELNAEESELHADSGCPAPTPSTGQTLSEELDDSQLSPPARRNTRRGIRDSGISLDSPEKTRSMLEQLRDKKRSICEDANGTFVDTACHICGVNMPQHVKKFYVNNRYDLAGLRMHYRACHAVTLRTLDEVYTMCSKTVLTDQDVHDILHDRMPVTKSLLDSPQPKKVHLKARMERGNSDALTDSETSNPGASTINRSTSVSRGETPQGDQAGMSATQAPLRRTSTTTAPKRKRRERSDNIENDDVPLATRRRARLSDSSGAMDMSSPTMQGL